jgi:hypothetical protein
MSATNALARTVDLVQADVFPDLDNDSIVEALTNVRVRLVADERNLSCSAGQTALVTTAIVAAQSGAGLVLDLPDVPVIGSQPPLCVEHLAEALLDLTSDLIVPATRDDGLRSDLTVVLGSTPVAGAGNDLVRLTPLDEGFELAPSAAAVGSAWTGNGAFSALFGGIAAGAEAFQLPCADWQPVATLPG